MNIFGLKSEKNKNIQPGPEKKKHSYKKSVLRGV